MSDAPSRLVGQLVSGRYRVLDTIGTGGMGQVYLAEHVAIQKRVALKVLHPEYSSKHDIVERFRQEAISASRIKHPNVLEIFDYGELEDGSSFIAMELLEGRDLGHALEKDGPLPAEAAIEVLLQICRALEAAHARGVVHRDLKPDNVFLQKQLEGDSIVKIVDFGIASLRSTDDATQHEAATKRRLTRTGMIFGTPEYMAPEQAQGKQADQRSDVYAAGVILFETLTGAVPFNGDTFLEVLNRHVLFPIPRLADVNKDVVVSTELENVVRRAMAKDPAARFGSMREFADALLTTPEAAALGSGGTLGAWRGGGGTPRGVTQVRGTPLTATTTPEPSVDRSPARWAVAGGVGAALIAAGTFAFLRLGRSEVTVEQAAATPEVSSPAPAPQPSEPAPAAATAGAAPAEPENTEADAAPQAILLSVTTTPPGAVLLKDGFQVCDATPCEVRAEPNETLVLTAQLGARRGEAKVLAQRDQKISILLAQAPSKAPKKAAPAKAEAPKLCEVVVDGLKILRPCQ